MSSVSLIAHTESRMSAPAYSLQSYSHSQHNTSTFRCDSTSISMTVPSLLTSHQPAFQVLDPIGEINWMFVSAATPIITSGGLTLPF